MKNFVEQILKKFGGFYLIKMNLVPTVLYTSTPKYRWKFRISADSQTVKYRSIYRSVSCTKRSFFSSKQGCQFMFWKVLFKAMDNCKLRPSKKTKINLEH